MSIEKTLSIIKPDAVADNIIGQIYARLEASDLKIIAARMLHLTETQVSEFYAVHREQPFFQQLVKFMTSGPVMVQVLEGENAVARYRELMGATMPEDAAPGTIRHDFAQKGDKYENAMHGSDSNDNAKIEIEFFFSDDDICQRTR